MDNDSIITIRDMLATMETGDPFILEWVTYDRKKGTGGEVRKYEGVLLWSESQDDTTTKTLKKVVKTGNSIATVVKPPQHYNNYTRNMRVYADGHPTNMIVKFHPPLCLYFNNKIVVP